MVKGAHSRAQLRRALDHRLRFPNKTTGKRERGALGLLPNPEIRAPLYRRSTGRSWLSRDCTTEVLLLMCLLVCFQAGRLAQMDHSWTAFRCSRKWMSGHAVSRALAPCKTDPLPTSVAPPTPSALASQEILPESPRTRVFSLDRSLSWKSLLCGACVYLSDSGDATARRSKLRVARRAVRKGANQVHL